MTHKVPRIPDRGLRQHDPSPVLEAFGSEKNFACFAAPMVSWCLNTILKHSIVFCTLRMETTGKTRGRQLPHCHRSGTAIPAAFEELQRFLG